MRNILTLLLFITSTINVGLFLFWLSLVHVEMAGKDQAKYIYDSTATNVMILQVVFALVLISTSVIAVFWYHSVKDAAMVNVSKAVDLYLRENGPQLVRQQMRDATRAE